jgi:hypothetical protein
MRFRGYCCRDTRIARQGLNFVCYWNWLAVEPKSRLGMNGRKGRYTQGFKVSMALNPEFTALLNSRPIIWRLRSSAPQVDALVTAVLASILPAGLRAGGLKATPEGIASAVRCLLLNLLYLRFSDPTRYLAIGMASGAYREGFSYRAQRIAVERLVLEKLIDFRGGFWSHERKKGFVTRIRAKEALMKIAYESGVGPSHIVVPPRTSLTELRDANDEVIEWPKDEVNQPELRRMEGNLDAINHCLGQCFIGLHLPDSGLQRVNDELQRKRPEASWIDYYHRQLYRVFNDDPQHGGRFFGGWWQEVPSEYRKHIHLAAPGQEPKWAVEFDFKSMHPAMLYARVRSAAPLDCYDLGGAYLRQPGGRDYAKQALLTF